MTQVGLFTKRKQGFLDVIAFAVAGNQAGDSRGIEAFLRTQGDLFGVPAKHPHDHKDVEWHFQHQKQGRDHYEHAKQTLLLAKFLKEVRPVRQHQLPH